MPCTPLLRRFVWRALSARYRPRVVVIEYTAEIAWERRWVVDPADKKGPIGTQYAGASLRAMADLGRRRGYTLVACNSNGVNAYFVRADILACQGARVSDPSTFAVLTTNAAVETDPSREWLVLDEGGNVVGRHSCGGKHC